MQQAEQAGYEEDSHVADRSFGSLILVLIDWTVELVETISQTM